MDNISDVTITFNEKGFCNYCTDAIDLKNKEYFPNEIGEKKLNQLLEDIKTKGNNRKYDCIMGISGGLDSSYLAYLGYKWGLRVLTIHIDDGYDTEISKSNLNKIVAKTGFDYEIISPDKQQFNALTLAYMKAGVPNIAIPQDNVLMAFLYQKMREYNIPYFLSGGNYATECILQRGNSYKSSDVVNIKDIHKKFGTTKINKLIFLSSIQKEIFPRILHKETFKLLNFIDYNRNRAFEELSKFCGFEYYGRKHLENILTAFIQLYWLPKKFGVDKRTSHLSSMIVSGQMTREAALLELSEPLYDERTMNKYITIIKKNLNISDDDFEALIKAPTHQHTEYKTEDETLIYKLFKLIHLYTKH